MNQLFGIRAIHACLCTILLCLFAIGHSQTIEDLAKTAEWEQEIPGSWKLYHCHCRGHYIMPTHRVRGVIYTPFPEDTPEHPKKPQDILWHRFMRGILTANKISGYSPDSSVIDHILNQPYVRSTPQLLSEYLNSIQKLKRILEEERVKKIKELKRLWSTPKSIHEQPIKIKEANQRYDAGISMLTNLSSELVPLYQNVLDSCRTTDRDNMAILYNAGLISLTRGDYETALKEISRFIELADTPAHRTLLTSHIFQAQGETYFEVGRYHEAIEALTEAIRRDPDNKEAHLWRAFSYFEGGHFDESLKDFLASGASSERYEVQPISAEFLAVFPPLLPVGCRRLCRICAQPMPHCLWTRSRSLGLRRKPCRIYETVCRRLQRSRRMVRGVL